jgi:hypothetical protein
MYKETFTFRYMAVLVRGGVYADADSECLYPISLWASNAASRGKPCTFFMGLENKVHFAQWAFAASPRHQLLQSVLDTLLPDIITQNFDLTNEHFVHKLTGPGVFREGILRELLASQDRARYLAEDGITVDLDKLLEAKQSEWMAQGLCVVSRREFESLLENKYSSQGKDFLSEKWSSWKSEADALHFAATGKKSLNPT